MPLRQNMEYLTRYDPEANFRSFPGIIFIIWIMRPMIAFHKRNQADLTVAMMEVPSEQTRHFGIAEVDGQGRIRGWEEKPKEPKGTLASLGIYVFQASYLLKALQDPRAMDFGHDLIPSAIKRDRVFAYPFSGYWRDVGTLAFYFEAHMDLLNPESGLNPEAWGVQTNLEEEGLKGDRPAGSHSKKCPGGSILSFGRYRSSKAGWKDPFFHPGSGWEKAPRF